MSTLANVSDYLLELEHKYDLSSHLGDNDDDSNVDTSASSGSNHNQSQGVRTFTEIKIFDLFYLSMCDFLTI
jgi:hypothetical protein